MARRKIRNKIELKTEKSDITHNNNNLQANINDSLTIYYDLSMFKITYRY